LQGLQFLARLETDGLAGRNGDFSASARIAADAGLARADVEDAESAKLDAFAASQSPLHAFEDGFDGHFRFRLGNAGPVDYFIDDVEFDQCRLRKLNDRIGVIALSSPDLFRRACSLFPTGIAVLTTRAAGGAPHGITINSFSSISLTPPLVMVAIAHDCTFLNHFETSGFFAVNFLRESEVDLSVRFAQLPEGRFTGVNWTAGVTGAPLIDGVLGILECRTVQRLDVGDHRVLIGDVVEVGIGEGRPLVFFESEYTKLG
jgi:flavin reductase (DIM6/NTAB) family NADH-FMN oxidoreductase RutF